MESIQNLISRRKSLLLLSSNSDVKSSTTLLEKRKGTILEPHPEHILLDASAHWQDSGYIRGDLATEYYGDAKYGVIENGTEYLSNKWINFYQNAPTKNNRITQWYENRIKDFIRNNIPGYDNTDYFQLVLVNETTGANGVTGDNQIRIYLTDDGIAAGIDLTTLSFFFETADGVTRLYSVYVPASQV